MVFHLFFYLLFIIFVFRWLYGKISRERAEELLQPRVDGLYLVRESTSFPGDYTLCVCFEGKVEHYRVMCTDSQMTIDNEEFFNNLKQLIEVRLTERCLQASLFCCNYGSVDIRITFFYAVNVIYNVNSCQLL